MKRGRSFTDYFNISFLHAIGNDAFQGTVAYLCCDCVVNLCPFGKRMIMQILQYFYLCCHIKITLIGTNI